MGKMGGFTAADLKKLQKQLNKIQQGNVEAFIDACAKELAARLLAKVIKRTPVGQYPNSSGKKGGTLRRGWTSATHEEAASGSGRTQDSQSSRVGSRSVHAYDFGTGNSEHSPESA